MIRRAFDPYKRRVPNGTRTDVALILGRTPEAVKTRDVQAASARIRDAINGRNINVILGAKSGVVR